MYLSIIIPAYNEEKRIEQTLEAVRVYLHRKHNLDTAEVIVVNDGSTDRTNEIIQAFIPKLPHLILIEYPVNQGKGYAVRKGMLTARGDLRLFMDADNATSIEQLDKLLPFIADFDVVISSRRLPESRTLVIRSYVREFLSRIFTFITKSLLPVGVSDTQNGFKLFTVKAAETLFSKQTINGWAFDVETLVLARRLGLKVKEIPVDWINGGHSRMTFFGACKMGKELLIIYWKSR